MQGHHFTQVGDDVRDREDHRGRGADLHPFAIEVK